jgi:co-chaperonin GroES (HSP10)
MQTSTCSSNLVRPVNENILVKAVEVPATTKSGLYLSVTPEKDVSLYTVISVPDTMEGYAYKGLTPGLSRILIGRYVGDEIILEDGVHKMVKFTDILAIVDQQ